MSAKLPDLSPDEWARARALFEEAVALPPGERADYLSRSCGSDRTLHEAIEALLEADAAPRGILDASPQDLSRLLAEDEGQPALHAGDTIDRYTIERELGHGGHAIVYLALDRKHGRQVALKVLRPELALPVERFLREIQIAATLSHPHVLPLHDSGEVNGTLYYVMPYVPGESLRDRLQRERQLPVEEALRIAREVALALGHAHSQGVVHRDIKPENILLSGGVAVVADFGIARAMTVAAGVTVTETGVAIGTPAYMSPEQTTAEVDGRSDIYSLGCVLYEMLVGHAPYSGSTAQEVLARHALDPIPTVRAARAAVPATVERAVTRALAKQPADRFATAAEFAAALTMPGVSRAAPAWLWRRPRTLGLVVGGLGLALVAGAVLRSRAGPTAKLDPNVTDALSYQNSPPAASLAVLPLKNYSGNPGQEYFADGMTEELITTLTKIETMRVIAHQSMLQFKHSERSVPDIARLLDVQYVVDGSVQQDADRVRITATLIDAARNVPIWSERFERERRDILALQRDVALAIAKQVEVTLTPQDRARLEPAPSGDLQAFDLYLKGTQARHREAANWNTSGLHDAGAYFAAAIEKDSSYAPAYAGLAYVKQLSGEQSQARELAERALRLDPNLAEAHVVLGVVLELQEWDWAGAEDAFRTAIRLNPGYAEAHHELSLLLMRRRRFDEALPAAQHALYLAPMSERFQLGLSQVYLNAGRYEEAIGAADRALAIDPSSVGSNWWLGMAYGLQGRHREAAEALEKCPLWCSGALGEVYAAMGSRAKAREVLDTLQAQRQRDPESEQGTGANGLMIVWIHMALGEREQALDWLERTVQPGAGWVVDLAASPKYNSLRAEPRFQALLKKMGLE